MTPAVVAQVVARLYAAAGRRYDEVTLQAWHEALDHENDVDAVDSAIDYLRALPAGEAPNIAAYITTLRQRARRRALEQRALPESGAGETAPAEAQANIAELRRQLKDHPIKRADEAIATRPGRRRPA